MADAQTQWVSQESGFFENNSAWVPQQYPDDYDTTAVFGQPIAYNVGLLSDHAIGGLLVGNGTDVNFTTAGGSADGETPPNRIFSVANANVTNASLRFETTSDPDASDIFFNVSHMMEIDGDLHVSDGARINAGSLNIGNHETPLATARFTGSDTQNGSTQLNVDTLHVGNLSKADLHILNGAVVNSQTAVVGQNQPLNDSALNRVEMSRATWNVDDLTVGLSGKGQVFPKFGVEN